MKLKHMKTKLNLCPYVNALALSEQLYIFSET